MLLGLPFNYTRPWELNVTVYERCTSVYGEPTRGTALDGMHGRHSERVMVAQPRRQRPGWDGCRDRHDNRTDLPHALQWDHPPQRSGHAAVYIGGGPRPPGVVVVSETHSRVTSPGLRPVLMGNLFENSVEN